MCGLHLVEAAPAIYVIHPVCVTRVDKVVARASVHLVVAFAGDDLIVAAAPFDCVLPAASVEGEVRRTYVVLASVKQERRSGLHQKVRSSGSQSHHYRATTPRMPSSIHPRQRALAPIPMPSLRRGILECSC